MVPYIKENKLIIDISLDYYYYYYDCTGQAAAADRALICVFSFRILLQSIVYSVFATFVVFQLMRLVSEWRPFAVINVLASNYAIEFVNNGIGTCILPWTCEH